MYAEYHVPNLSMPQSVPFMPWVSYTNGTERRVVASRRSRKGNRRGKADVDSAAV